MRPQFLKIIPPAGLPGNGISAVLVFLAGWTLPIFFTNIGPHTVALVVNNAWCADTASLNINIVAPPMMAFSANPDTICPQEGCG